MLHSRDGGQPPGCDSEGAAMRRVEEFMTAGPQVIRSELPLREAAERMKELGVHHLPVVDGGDLVACSLPTTSAPTTSARSWCASGCGWRT